MARTTKRMKGRLLTLADHMEDWNRLGVRMSSFSVHMFAESIKEIVRRG